MCVLCALEIPFSTCVYHVHLKYSLECVCTVCTWSTHMYTCNTRMTHTHTHSGIKKMKDMIQSGKDTSSFVPRVHPPRHKPSSSPKKQAIRVKNEPGPLLPLHSIPESQDDKLAQLPVSGRRGSQVQETTESHNFLQTDKIDPEFVTKFLTSR